MSDEPYRVQRSEQDRRFHVVVGPAFVTTHILASDAERHAADMNAAHRAATEKAAKVVEAARNLVAAVNTHPDCPSDEKWWALENSGTIELLFKALADYDRD